MDPGEAFMYLLDEARNPVATSDSEAWGQMLRGPGRRVAHDSVTGRGGEVVTVSTVFLGLDHRYAGEGPPIVFETLVFGGVMADSMDRYATWAEAEEGHACMLQRVQGAEREGGDA